LLRYWVRKQQHRAPFPSSISDVTRGMYACAHEHRPHVTVGESGISTCASPLVCHTVGRASGYFSHTLFAASVTSVGCHLQRTRSPPVTGLDRGHGTVHTFPLTTRHKRVRHKILVHANMRKHFGISRRTGRIDGSPPPPQEEGELDGCPYSQELSRLRRLNGGCERSAPDRGISLWPESWRHGGARWYRPSP
jgi:hypothetical protein